MQAGNQALLAFALGALGSILGTLVAWQVVGLLMGSYGRPLAACLCATYIGGSMNFAALALVSAGTGTDSY